MCSGFDCSERISFFGCDKHCSRVFIHITIIWCWKKGDTKNRTSTERMCLYNILIKKDINIYWEKLFLEEKEKWKNERERKKKKKRKRKMKEKSRILYNHRQQLRVLSRSLPNRFHRENVSRLHIHKVLTFVSYRYQEIR